MTDAEMKAEQERLLQSYASDDEIVAFRKGIDVGLKARDGEMALLKEIDTLLVGCIAYFARGGILNGEAKMLFDRAQALKSPASRTPIVGQPAEGQTDAVKILHDRYIKGDPERLKSLEDARSAEGRGFPKGPHEMVHKQFLQQLKDELSAAREEIESLIRGTQKDKARLHNQTKEIFDAKKEIESRNKTLDAYASSNVKMQQAISGLRTRNEKLREALGFYANKASWFNSSTFLGREEYLEIDMDDAVQLDPNTKHGGKRAAEALRDEKGS